MYKELIYYTRLYLHAVAVPSFLDLKSIRYIRPIWSTGADPGFVERGGGAAAVPFEDPLWNFKRGGRRGRAPSLALLEDPLWNFKRRARAPCAPPLNPLVVKKALGCRPFCTSMGVCVLHPSSYSSKGLLGFDA